MKNPGQFSVKINSFDLDPCQPEQGRAFLSVPADNFYTQADDGLTQPWFGCVWLNPPFGGRNGVIPWLEKFVQHGDGIALVNALTSSGWFHRFAPNMDALLFPKGKTKFVKPDGTRGMSPANGVVLMSIGPKATSSLMQASRADLGIFTPIVKDDLERIAQ
ncbi:DNA N-6-adenine-methyltransferase [Kozakia baliensis]|uniref:DNA N-6-adenine-methyltransferase n=1 Tax=Kozakia baliensis TaxID=153496 RepID=UPI00068D5707|nr:DNA N-6-adenine-methyltransferase [Kozakia baliensis]